MSKYRNFRRWYDQQSEQQGNTSISEAVKKMCPQSDADIERDLRIDLCDVAFAQMFVIAESYAQHRIASLQEELATANKRIETLDQKLAACGVAAKGWFNGCHDDYKSASLTDVLKLRQQSDHLRRMALDVMERIGHKKTLGWFGIEEDLENWLKNPNEYDALKAQNTQFKKYFLELLSQDIRGQNLADRLAFSVIGRKILDFWDSILQSEIQNNSLDQPIVTDGHSGVDQDTATTLNNEVKPDLYGGDPEDEMAIS